jgi:signal transduction histidine kinase/putative methionine-R-sulfoxide reductase with GAF domain
MARALPTEFDLIQLYQQFCADLTQAQSLEAGVDRCVALLESCFAPRTCGVEWGVGHGLRVLGPNPGAQTHQPTPDELAQLRRGEPAIRADGEHIAAGFAPLCAQGVLMGWLYIEEPVWSDESRDLFAAAAAMAGPALALLEAAGRQDERVQQLKTLNEVGRLLSGVLDLDTLLEAIYDATRRLVDTANFFIAFYDPSADMFELAFLVEEDERHMLHERWSARAGLAGVVIRERHPLRTDDYFAECQRRGLVPSPFGTLRPDGAWLGVPLIAHDRIIGVMSISSQREGYTYSNEHIDLLSTIAAQAAIAIENARLYQRSERQARQLATLNRIGRTITSSLDPQRVPSLIIEQVCELLGVEEGSLLLADDATGDLIFTYTTGPFGSRLLGQRLPRGVGLAGYVATNGISVIVNDAQNDNRFYAATDRSTGFTTRAILAAPLRGVGGVQGVIEVMNKRDGSVFTEEDQRLMEAVADQAVIALENAQRFAQVDQALARRAQELTRTNDLLQHNLRSLTALNALGMAINTSLRDANEIFAMTARGVVEMTNALGACVFLPDRAGFRAAVQIGPAPPFDHQIAPLLSQVMHNVRPEVVDAELPPSLAQIGAGALLAVPLRATQKTLGALCVYYASDVPSAPDQETVVLFATQAAVAVESLQLFTAVRDAHDHMASVLASTREGIMLIEIDERVAVANDALHRLCRLPRPVAPGLGVTQFLGDWEQAASFAAEEWAALRHGLAAVTSGRELFASGELNEISAHPRSIAWSALKALRSGDRALSEPGGALLVLRNITEAKESERLRQDLTNMIVHDLRSPLSSVMASIDMLIRGISGELNKPQRNVLNIAYSSSLQMLEMINTLLDISRLEDGRMPLKLATHHIPQLSARAIERLTSLAQDRAMAIQTDIPNDLTPVLADDELIVRVLQNLLGNALNFSGRGSTVLVRATQGAREQPGAGSGAQRDRARGRAGFVTIAVSDRGVGIAPKDQEKIFAKFGQVGPRRGGTGLGLTFCKLAVETHGGEIWVESTLGEGSTFFFTLPTAA